MIALYTNTWIFIMNTDQNDIRLDLLTDDTDKALQVVFGTVSEKIKLSLANAKKAHIKRLKQIHVTHG